MKLNSVKLGIAFLLLIELSGCGGGGSSSAGGSSASTAVSGVAQGPLLSGTTVTVNPVDSTLTPVTGKQATITTSTSLGTFSASAVPGSNLELTANGNYFDETTGTTTGSLTLSSYASNTDTTLNVNILTTLALQRIKSLVNGGMTFSAARQQAEKEVLAAFYIRDHNYILGKIPSFGSLDLSMGRDEDHILAAIASVFEYGGNSNAITSQPSTSQLVSNLINGFQRELAANNGIIATTSIVNSLVNNSKGINAATVASNLNTEYSSVSPSLFSATNISDWLDQDGDQVLGKFKYIAVQAQANTSYTFPAYTVGASDDRAAYSFAPKDSPNIDPTKNPYINPNLNPNPNSNPNSPCKISVGGAVVTTVHAGDSVVVSCTPLAHEASSTYLQSIPSLPTVPTGMSTPIYVARYTFNPFATVAPMTYAPLYPTATVLQNGNVLVAGGSVAGSATATAELYNPTTNTWTATGNMTVARVGHTATLLTNGKVLVVGGDKPGAGTAELYDPIAGKWTKTGAPASGHIYHTATLLANGQVLVVGGILTSATTTTAVELYDPSLGWTPLTASTTTLYGGPRYYHTATLLQDCSVLITGGFNGTTAISDAEIFKYSSSTPSTCSTVSVSAVAGTWTQVGTTSGTTTAPGVGVPGSGLNTASYSHTATLLQNGTVLIAGGTGTAGTALARTEVFDPGDVGNSAPPANFSTYSNLNTARGNHIAQLLSDGSVLVAGGSNINGTLTSAELLGLTATSWTQNGNLAYPRYDFTSVLLSTVLPNNNDVLLVGGGVTAAETFQ